jgi:DNA end-binding protein Ku
MALAKITVRVPEIDATFTASLIPVKESSKPVASFTSVCPHCEATTKLNQKMYCPNDEKHGPFGKNDVAKGREVSKGKYIKVTDEEIAAIKEPTLQANLLELTAFRSEQVDAATRPTGTAYFIAVTEGSTAKMLFDLLATNPDKALVGELTLATTQKMFRLSTWNRSLFLQELIRPTEIAAPVEVGGTEYKERLFALYNELLEEAVEDFDPLAFTSRVRARIAELDSQLGAQLETVTARDVSNATLDGLEALLAAKRAAKTTKAPKMPKAKKEAA